MLIPFLSAEETVARLAMAGATTVLVKGRAEWTLQDTREDKSVSRLLEVMEAAGMIDSDCGYPLVGFRFVQRVGDWRDRYASVYVCATQDPDTWSWHRSSFCGDIREV